MSSFGLAIAASATVFLAGALVTLGFLAIGVAGVRSSSSNTRTFAAFPLAFGASLSLWALLVTSLLVAPDMADFLLKPIAFAIPATLYAAVLLRFVKVESTSSRAAVSFVAVMLLGPLWFLVLFVGLVAASLLA